MQQSHIEAPAEMLAAVMGRPHGWDTILDAMAEHSELGPRGILALAAFKLDHPEADTSTVLSRQRADMLGGKIMEHPAGFEILVPFARRVDDELTLDCELVPETVYPASAYIGLTSCPGAAPISVVEGDAVALDAVSKASEDVDLEGMDPMASHVTLRRYGVDDGLEVRVPMEDTELLLARIERVCAQVRGATGRIDRALKRAGFECKPRTRSSQGDRAERGQSAAMTTRRLKSMLASFDAGARGTSNNSRKGA